MSDYISREAAMEIVKRTSGDYAAAFSETGASEYKFKHKNLLLPKGFPTLPSTFRVSICCLR